MLTASEIIEKLKSVGDVVEDFSSVDLLQEGIPEELDLGIVEKTECYGGEGRGDDYWSIQYFKDHDVYIKISGYYSSNYGIHEDTIEFREVKPSQKTITVYQ